ncbi:MAG: ATP-binding sensor histidine kinase [Leptospirales bacterium]
MKSSIINDYETIKKLYESEFTVVWRAKRKTDLLPVILKINKKSGRNFKNESKMLSFLKEAEKTKKEDNIVNLLSVEVANKEPMLVFNDDGSITLQEWIKNNQSKNKILRNKEFLKTATKIVDVVEFVHNKGIIHLDLNPLNIIVNPDTGKIKLIDFQFATLLSQDNKHIVPSGNLDGPLQGTLEYISPEQTGRINRAVDYYCDLYSLGVIFYELLTGNLPFHSDDPLELIHAHLAVIPKPPHKVDVKIPIIISNIIMKLLAKNAEDRYQSAFGLCHDLEKCNQDLKEFSLGSQDYSRKLQISGKLYGRNNEINTLLSAFQRVASGETEIMLVTGYSGIGKSVLVKEAYKQISNQPGYFVSGKFDQLKRNIPYTAIIIAFANLMQQLLTEARDKLSTWKQKILEGLGPNGQVIIDVIPQVELIIGKQPPIPQLGPTESQNRFNLVFQNFIRTFCKPDHPLTIFLDDLQWVDSATLKLLELVLTDQDNNGLFIIGAYRDNEVDSTHLVMNTLDKLRDEHVDINHIALKPLIFEHINQLIAESLHQSLKQVESLTNLLMKKTNGNPFFVNQFLYTLYEENLLQFSAPTRTQKFHWGWDIQKIKMLNITDNVVDLMIEKLKKLPDSTQQIVRLAACVGNRFDLYTLSVIYEKSVKDTFQDLMPMLRERLILPLSEFEIGINVMNNPEFQLNELKFLHDRVQQGAYTLISDEKKQAVHLQIGRLLLKSTTPDNLEENIFDIVGHYNRAIELVTKPKEKCQIAELNLMAGQKAKFATAYDAAVDYFSVGRNCLTNDCWEIEYNLTRDLYTETTEAAYLIGDFEQMDQFAEAVLHYARAIPDEVKICELQIQAYIAQDQYIKAIEIAKTFLNRLGIVLSEESFDQEADLILQQILGPLSNRKISSLIQLPTMTNVEKKYAMQTMMAVTSAAYMALPELLIPLAVTQIDISLNYGNSTESGFAYSLAGLILSSIPGGIEAGHQFGLLALAISEKLGEKRLRARAALTFNHFIRPWKEHARASLQPSLDAYQIGLEVGDMEYAAYLIHVHLYYSYFVGNPLVELEPELASYDNSIARLNQEAVLNWNYMWRQVVLNLMGHSDNPSHLSGEKYDENICLPRYLSTNDRMSLHYFYLNKCILHYMFQEYQQAIENADFAKEYLDGVTGALVVAIFHFYDSLARLALFPDLSRKQQSATLILVSANQDKMKTWAHHAPMNFQHKYDLVEAELSRVMGKHGDAREFYDKAIDLAHENQYINEEALAYELAGQFYLGKGNSKLAEIYLRDAHSAYQQWGALAKVKNLEFRFPEIFVPETNSTESISPTITSSRSASSSTKSGSTWIDLNSILKAAQTLSGEIALNKLLDKMMRIVIENAGAEKGFLILPNGDNWFIEAESSIEKSNNDILQSLPLEKSDQVSAKIIHYVIRSRENVVLHDAAKEGNFIRDAYIVKHSPKSVLCMPLINQGKLNGVLYLENNLMSAAFTAQRLETLNLLSSQIAVSIENSLIYNQLEEKVKERTKELKDSQDKIIVQEKMASLGNLTAGIAHEIKNPLNFINNFANLSNDLLKDLQDLLSNKETDPKIQEVIDTASANISKIEEHGQRANDIINSMLLHSRGGSGNFQATNLNKLVKDSLNLTYHSLRATNTDFNIEIIENYKSIPEISLIPQDVSRVFLNVINNAMYATHLKKLENKNYEPNIEVSTSNTKTSVRISIKDNGPGMSDEVKAKLFEPFFTTKPTGKGTGLGLSISYDIVVKEHKGKIEVSSELGEYTEFVITLPYAPSARD